MKVLLVSPLGFAINPDTKYAGIERLVWNYANQLNKMGHQVLVLGRSDSVYPEDVEHYKCDYLRDDFFYSEVAGFQRYQSVIRKADVIHDFSHAHFASRIIPNLPSLNIFWHDPVIQYPKAPYNIIALSQWAKRQFEHYYHQPAFVQQSIAINPMIYHPLGARGDRFLTLGRMAPEKGNLRALELCCQLDVSLDICGGRGQGIAGTPLTAYEMKILRLCDTTKRKFWGEVTEEDKIKLMQSCKALIYATTFPEVTNYKLQEAMFCGAPVIVPNIGAMPEIVTNGIDGWLCNNPDEFLNAIQNIDQLHPENIHNATVNKYSVEIVVKNYIPLYEQVAGGLHW